MYVNNAQNKTENNKHPQQNTDRVFRVFFWMPLHAKHKRRWQNTESVSRRTQPSCWEKARNCQDTTRTISFVTHCTFDKAISPMVRLFLSRAWVCAFSQNEILKKIQCTGDIGWSGLIFHNTFFFALLIGDVPGVHPLVLHHHRLKEFHALKLKAHPKNKFHVRKRKALQHDRSFDQCPEEGWGKVGRSERSLWVAAYLPFSNIPISFHESSSDLTAIE